MLVPWMFPLYLSQSLAMWTPSPAQMPAASGETSRSKSGGCLRRRSNQKVTKTARPTPSETERCRGRYTPSSASMKTVRKPTSSEPRMKRTTRRATALGVSRLRRATALLDVEDQPCRILERFLHRDERQHRLASVDDAVIVRERQVIHRPDHDLAVLDDRAVLGRVDAEDGALRRVDDRRREHRAEDAAVGDREGPAG